MRAQYFEGAEAGEVFHVRFVGGQWRRVKSSDFIAKVIKTHKTHSDLEITRMGSLQQAAVSQSANHNDIRIDLSIAASGGLKIS